MNLFHVQQRFHPVGHGTFMTGVLTDGEHTQYGWVYDCGSRRKRLLEDALDRMQRSKLWPAPIDMLVLSHFDDDHVNGLEALLKVRGVKNLVLPFSDWQQRVREICVGGKKGVTPSTAQLQLDPLTWLQSLDLTGQVETLLLVRGGPATPDSNPPRPVPQPTGPDQRGGSDIRNVDGVDLVGELRLGANNPAGALVVREIHHQTPLFSPGIPLEFMFYNAELSGTELKTIDTVKGIQVARKSKVPIAQVRCEIESEMVKLGLSSNFSAWPSGWRSRLKQCYEKHFGSTSHARNNISLCMSTSPVSSAIGVGRCVAFTNPSDANDLQTMNSFDFLRPGVLCTGDLKLSRAGIAAMKTHFGAAKWGGIGLTQVPHHGSKHSWAPGNAALLASTTFVQCAPGTPAHPHKDVIKDLTGHRVFTADYKNSVTLQYHFKTP